VRGKGKKTQPVKNKVSSAPGGAARKPHLVEVTLERLAWGGRAVGKSPDGKVVFVAKAAPGDKVLARLERQKSHYGEGRVHAVLSPSPDRVAPRCKFFSHCGGCQWLCVAPARQRAEKETMLRWALRESLHGCEPEALAFAEADLGYRHRGDFHLHATGGTVHLGFYQDATHKVVNLDTCPLFSRRFNEVYGELRRRLKAHPLAIRLDGLTLAASEDEGAFAAHLRLLRGGGPVEAHEILKSLWGCGISGGLATPAKRPEEILAEMGRTDLTYGVEFGSGDGRVDVLLQVGVRSFTQAHFALNRTLVAQTLDWLALSGADRLLDLYAGAGNFSVPAARMCREVLAVEGAPWACADGRANAARQGLGNLVHVEDSAEARVAALADQGERFDAVLLDPPRSGAAGALDLIARLRPSRIAYVSCNLPTLGRDLATFEGLGYALARVRGFDLFPQTYNLETLCLLRPK
jgi:23S rRNA (uracil1939-C5)-methyltransferase